MACVSFQNWLNSSVNRFGKLRFLFRQQVFESISFRSVKVGFRSFGVLVNRVFGHCQKSSCVQKFVSGLSSLLWYGGALSISASESSSSTASNKACTRRWGFCAIFKQFSTLLVFSVWTAFRRPPQRG